MMHESVLARSDGDPYLTTNEPPATGTHQFVPDPRNAEVLIDVNGTHVPRPQATVSVFDSGFMLGDGVWEGLRVHQGRIAFLDRHLDRLYRGPRPSRWTSAVAARTWSASL
jgi:hypothetical protein